MKIKVAEAIKRLRIEHNLTQAELADRLSVSPQAVSRWENGQAYPDIELFSKIADCFNVTVDELMGREIADSVELASKFRTLYKQYFENGAKDDAVLLRLCDMAEKLCTIDEPIKYIARYYELAKRLSVRTRSKLHISHARAIGHSLFPSTDVEHLNTILLNFVYQESENQLEQWKTHLTSNAHLSTWNDFLLRRYFHTQDKEKWNVAYQKSIYDHLDVLLGNLTWSLHQGIMGMFDFDNEVFGTSRRIERCRLALYTLSLYSRDVFDLFLPQRFHIESELTKALFAQGETEAGWRHLEILRQLAVKLRQMVDEQTVRRGSVPILALVEQPTVERDAHMVEAFLLQETDTAFDEVRRDERFLSIFRELRELFSDDAMETKVHRRIAFANRFLRDVLKEAVKELPMETRAILLEHFAAPSEYRRTHLGLRNLEAIRNPQAEGLKKADLAYWVRSVKAEMPNPKHNLTFLVTVKDGYLRSIVSSEAEENLPFSLDEYKISIDPLDEWSFAENAKKLYSARGIKVISPANGESVVVMLSAKGKVYTAHFSTLEESTAGNIDQLAQEMKKNDDTKIQRLVCYLAGGLDLPSYAFRDQLCRLDRANLDALILLQGKDAPIVKPLSATMAKGYQEKLTNQQHQ
ncbi:MAG: helix-turn-helix domain-containing protein [Clostridia bacterium]|nr:helix-turn-helix domain-containing protein [Clostridia bacterium]